MKAQFKSSLNIPTKQFEETIKNYLINKFNEFYRLDRFRKYIKYLDEDVYKLYIDYINNLTLVRIHDTYYIKDADVDKELLSKIKLMEYGNFDIKGSYTINTLFYQCINNYKD